MELKTIEIRNFRSIKDEKIQFKHNCLIMLGKNEAGKSNVLKAIAAVFGEYIVADKDKRKKIDNEKIDPNQYYSRGIISFSQEDINKIEEQFRGKFNGIENIIFNSGINLNDFIKKVYKDLIIEIKIGNDSKPNFSYLEYKESDIELRQKVFMSYGNIELEGIAEFNLEEEFFIILKEYYLQNPIKCHYWQYNDSLLLPSLVDINDFIKNPSSFKALENIFQLCEREDINKEFANAKSEDGDYANLLDQVSKKVTKTFQKIWKDFNETSIQLLPDGNQILIKISDKAKYNCEDRSDGFKKFISILLMLSTQSRVNKISENDLILIDEPDQSLYPTSAKFLRDELLMISKKSKVIYSTHSQYMIDVNNLDRHIVVEKLNDITKLNNENSKSPYVTDEILKRAIGSSIFECLKPINIIFEGYLDKKLFDKYCEFYKKEDIFKKFGKIYSGGISGFGSIVSILDGASKKFIIVADSDRASNDKKIDFQNLYPDYKNSWFSYADVDDKISTMEDFLTTDFIESKIKKYNDEYIYDTKKNAITNIENATQDKEIKQRIKNDLMDNLKKINIKDSYSIYIDELKNKLDI